MKQNIQIKFWFLLFQMFYLWPYNQAISTNLYSQGDGLLQTPRFVISWPIFVCEIVH